MSKHAMDTWRRQSPIASQPFPRAHRADTDHRQWAQLAAAIHLTPLPKMIDSPRPEGALARIQSARVNITRSLSCPKSQAEAIIGQDRKATGDRSRGLNSL